MLSVSDELILKQLPPPLINLYSSTHFGECENSTHIHEVKLCEFSERDGEYKKTLLIVYH